MLLRRVVVLLAVVNLTVVTYVALRRCLYPFELEWMEGAMVDHVARLLEGKPLYVEPTIEFVPFIYGPLFFWLSAGVAKVVGLSFVPLRLVSIASMLGSFALLHAIVSKETGARSFGVIAAGAFAATYLRTAQYLDIGRVDSLALVLSLAAVYVMRNLRERRGYWIAGAVLLVLAFLAKQSSLILAFALIAHEAWVLRKRALPFAAATLGGAAVVSLALDWMYDGWFRYYAWELPRSHPFVGRAVLGFWLDDLAPAIAIAMAFGLFYLGAATSRREGARVFHLFAAAGLVGCGYVGRLHDGGWPNVLIPACAGFAILFALGLAAATDSENQRKNGVAFAVAGLQLAMLVFHPKRALPHPDNVGVGLKFIARVRAIPGDVFIPNHSHYARMAGKKPHAHRMAIDDVFRGDPHGEGKRLVADLRRALENKRWAVVMLDDDFFEPDTLRSYELGDPPFTGADTFYPPTGIHVRPQRLFVPKQ